MLDFSKANEWKIIETDFDPTALGKVEANFRLGNGCLSCTLLWKGQKLNVTVTPRIVYRSPVRNSGSL
ncbi:hypothetical protein D1646_20150 [Pseudoflavonifractor sp. 60]|uniref:hypothetical protein n=1 Tax=Pseudoflavonifractor sp. 60 TaxID=2304576 RepID=UPI00136A4FAF|nr:hypothetical protein [Pseudoflavonifractor sp. 60]NBI69050.1 hypothetical protein [Pseudoflavonifractor sp. 60]